MLLLERHANTNATATYAEAALSSSSDAPLTLGPPRSFPALERTDSPAVYRTARSQSNGRFARVERTGAAYTLFVHEGLADTAPRRLDLGALEPHAMLVTEHGAWLGSVTKVSYVDLEASALGLDELVVRAIDDRKAYDVFARAGDRVVAIDDVVRPIYADFFRLNARGRPSHLAGWDMPALVNGRYTHAALVREAGDAHTLYVVAPYGVLDGNGQVLASIPIEGNALGPVDRVLNSGASRARVVEEHQSRAEHMPSHFLVGDELSLFTGIAISNDRVLLPAGRRGLFVLPRALGVGVRADVVCADRFVHDVTVHEGRVFVLTSKGDENDLIELNVADGRFTEAVRTPLPEAFNRFVD